MPATAAPTAAAAPVSVAAPSVAAVGQLGRVSLAGVKKSKLKKVRGTVTKRTAVKRKKATVKRKRYTTKRKYTRTSRTYRRTAVRRVNRTYTRASRTAVRRTVARKVVKKAANPAPRAVAGGGVLRTAASLSGIYYRYGGTTRAGFDCSGFTSYVFRANGKSIPRTAAAQQRATRRVSSPQPGDLVFFGSPAFHVGIYAGGGMMYDSPRTGRTTGLHKIWSKNVSYGRA
ncbi:cell wall lytic activity [Arsenicicoccus sp. MKL-02]|uniref:Cell wall lytic activity n=2 Tax=Arsenicicoccus cauae TaxID=2663847 RepID=A0A6I3IAL0_9MICO|nr:cell wall lytic activity [Arsenicicoccus cauae]